MNGLGMGLGWFIPLVLVMLLMYLFTNNDRNGKKDDDRLSPKDILDIRLAKGDINKREYEERLKMLS